MRISYKDDNLNESYRKEKAKLTYDETQFSYKKVKRVNLIGQKSKISRWS